MAKLKPYPYKGNPIIRVIFADACRVAGVGPKELKGFVGNLEASYSVVAKAMDEHLARCLEKYLRPTMRDGAEGGEE